ncbi:MULTISPECIES: hypothetical protein [Methylobacterium]|uniref:hypothetical protein n=1 Tax=Methylobacterium TaxID=407 RepID=UPI0013EA9738|nr:MULTISPECIES: hypothetical protein [unclassified Methylobacterium]NGM38022.1 hypothetical protein [Methylobacterium sp. DB0501]
MTGDNDDFSPLHERLHAARRLLAEAYERRDVLARQIATVEATDGIGLPVDLMNAYGAAERAVLVAEADMKDAEHALAIASERLP